MTATDRQSLARRRIGRLVGSAGMRHASNFESREQDPLRSRNASCFQGKDAPPWQHFLVSRILAPAVIMGLAIWITRLRAQTSTGDQATSEIRVLELQGKVEVSPAGATTWVLTQTNQVLHPL